MRCTENVGSHATVILVCMCPVCHLRRGGGPLQYSEGIVCVLSRRGMNLSKMEGKDGTLSLRNVTVKTVE